MTVLPLGTVLEYPCPECGKQMTLRRAMYGLFYACVDYPTCNGSHGAHQNSGKPLGTPATWETKEWRKTAHANFDRIWKDGHMDRATAYQWMTSYLGLDLDGKVLHIGECDITTCRKIVQASQEFLNNPANKIKLPQIKGKLPIDK